MDSNYKEKLNVDFISSRNSREIQVSDAISGFVGRPFNIISHVKKKEILVFVDSLKSDDKSYKTLYYFTQLYNQSVCVSPYFVKFTIQDYINEKFYLLLEAALDKNSK